MNDHEAVALATLGYRMVPWRNRFDTKPRPLITDWINADASVETVAGWVERYPKADWAIVHKESVVLDIEMKHGLDGMRDLQNLQDQLGFLTHASTVASTKSNGRHLWFRKPANSPMRSGRIAPGIEVKCCDSSAHCPPSMGYAWIHRPVKAEDLEELPQEIVSLWQKNTTANTADYSKPVYGEGERRNMLCAMAKALRQVGLLEKELIAALTMINMERCAPMYPEADVIAIAKDYSKREIKDPVAAALAGDKNADHICQLMKRMGAWL
jgi:hypothetical protein